MNKHRDAGDCALGLLLVAVSVALGYGAMSMIFSQATIATAFLN